MTTTTATTMIRTPKDPPMAGAIGVPSIFSFFSLTCKIILISKGKIILWLHFPE